MYTFLAVVKQKGAFLETNDKLSCILFEIYLYSLIKVEL